MKLPTGWLLEGEPWIAYRTRVDLLGETEDSGDVQAARNWMFANPRLKNIFAELNRWPWTVISSHKSAGQPFHKLTFIADLGLTKDDQELHPYIFYMGTDFRKLKAPLVWYDLVHVLDVLSQFSWLKSDPRLREMVDVLKSKADSEGRFTIESVWAAWKDWEFGQKKAPSRWLTFLTWRIIQRVEAS